MVLTKAQSAHFIRIIDNIIAYVNGRFRIVPASALKTTNTHNQHKVMKRIWKDPDVIDDFLMENWGMLAKDDIAAIKHWSRSLIGYFTISRLPDGRLAFLRDGHAFIVHGISREIESMVQELPCLVNTMIVPFDGVIAYTMFLETMNVEIGSGMQQSLAREFAEASATGKVIETSEELIGALDAIRAENEDRAVREVVISAEDILAATEPIKGTHKGRLAGLNGRERYDAIREISQNGVTFDYYGDSDYDDFDDDDDDGFDDDFDFDDFDDGFEDDGLDDDFDDDDDSFDDDGFDDDFDFDDFDDDFEDDGLDDDFDPELDPYLDDDDFYLEDPDYMMSTVARSGRPKYAAGDLLGLMKKDELQRVVVDLGLPIPITLKKADLASALIDGLRDPDNLSGLTDPMPLPFLGVLERIVQAGGRLFIPNGKTESLDEVMPPYEPLLFLFHHREGFTYVIPDEFVPAAKEFDFGELAYRFTLRERVGKLATAATDLRGIVPLYEFIQDCRKMLPELEKREGEGEVGAESDRLTSIKSDRPTSTKPSWQLDDDEIAYITMEALAIRPSFGMLATEDDTFLLDSDLLIDYLKANPGATIPEKGMPFIMGELDENLDLLLDEQADKPPYEIGVSMLDYPIMPLWRMELPDAQALRAFFDGNIPDGEDDLTFADDMMLDFVGVVKHGYMGSDALERYMEVLEDCDFPMDEAHLQQFLQLLMRFVNSQPIWPNNGWPPVELAASS